MIEDNPVAFEVISSKTRKTEIGTVTRSDVLLGGQPERVYHPTGLTEAGLIDHVGRTRANREAYMKDPKVVIDLRAQGMTPQTHVESEARRLIYEFGEGDNPLYYPKSPLDLTIQDRAGEIVFKEAGPVGKILKIFKNNK